MRAGPRPLRRARVSRWASDAWSVRLQYKPLVRFIWLGAIVMALGGLLAAHDRRYRARVQASPRQCRPHAAHRAGLRRRNRCGGMLLPGAVVLGLLAAVFVVGPGQRSHARAIATGRQAGARVHAAPPREPRRLSVALDDCKTSLVLNVWGTWCAGCRQEHETLLALAQDSGMPHLRHQLEGRPRQAQAGWRSSAIPTWLSASTKRAASASTGASTAHPRPF